MDAWPSSHLLWSRYKLAVGNAALRAARRDFRRLSDTVFNGQSKPCSFLGQASDDDSVAASFPNAPLPLETKGDGGATQPVLIRFNSDRRFYS